jgi:hypothetical protein
MKLLSEEEAAAIPTKGRGRSSKVRDYLLNMKPGEILFIAASEWKWKAKPPSEVAGRIARASKKNIKFDCKKAIDNSGWIIKRLR